MRDTTNGIVGKLRFVEMEKLPYLLHSSLNMRYSKDNSNASMQMYNDITSLYLHYLLIARVT